MQVKSSPDNKSPVTHVTMKQNAAVHDIGLLNGIVSDGDVDPIQVPDVRCQMRRLVFPVSSPSFDVRLRRICFWGYGSGVETQFFVEADALKRLCPEMCNTEAGFLQAFDSARNQILDVADKVSLNNAKGDFSYILEAADF